MIWALSEKSAAVKARQAETESRKEAEQISGFMLGVFRSPDPTKDGREIRVVELLDNAVRKLETELADQPDLRAKLQATLAKTYYGLGLYREAVRLQEQVRDYHLAATGPQHFDTMEATWELSEYYIEGWACGRGVKSDENNWYPLAASFSARKILKRSARCTIWRLPYSNLADTMRR